MSSLVGSRLRDMIYCDTGLIGSVGGVTFTTMLPSLWSLTHFVCVEVSYFQTFVNIITVNA